MVALPAVFDYREDRGDGLDLRGVSYAGEPIVDRLYFAVRDRWWRTVQLTVLSSRRRPTPTGFEVEIRAGSTWSSHPVDVRLTYRAQGTVLDAEVTAVAGGPFAYCRIGFCLLLGEGAVRGRPATSWRTGRATSFVFPDEIVTRDSSDPEVGRFHEPFDRLGVRSASGTCVHAAFDGEEFEFEDQRNWTDASYKAYSVAPERGWSAAAAGQRFWQRIRIEVEPATHATRAVPDDRLALGGPVAVVPPVGLYAGRESERSYRPGGGFQELNARRPSAVRIGAHDAIELAVNGAVHAADDDSVLQATALHGALVRQARALFPALPVVLAPVSFLDVAGDWRDVLGHYGPEPPAGTLSCRAAGPFGAAWVVASAARALPAGPSAVRYLDASLAPDCPAARAVARLGKLAGASVLAVRAPAPVAALAVLRDGSVTIAVANTGPDPVAFRLPGGQAARLAGFGSAWFDLAVAACGVSAAPPASPVDPSSARGPRRRRRPDAPVSIAHRP